MHSERAPWYLRLATWGGVIFLHFPLLIIAIYAFNTEDAAFSFPPQGLTLRWFSEAAGRSDILQAVTLSLKIAALSTAIALVLGTLAAGALWRSAFFGKNAVSLLLLLPIALPGIITGLALLTAFKAVGLEPGLLTIDLVSREKLRHIFLVGGCDGARGERNYFTDFATSVPDDCLILTLACGKYRFNKLDFGDIEGLPRLVDAGQCNDAYSAIILAVTLAEKLGCGVNDLPLSLVLSWFEQKAIVILLTLLSLGVKNIVTGPTAPGFFTPDLLAVLNEKFGLRSVTTVEQDMQQLLSA